MSIGAPFRHDAVNSPAFGQAIERFCAKIVETLREPWLSLEERHRLKAEAVRRAEEAERLRLEADAQRQADEEEKLHERCKRDEWTRGKVETRGQTENEIAQPADVGELETQERSSTPWRPSRRDGVIAGVLVAAMAVGAAAWWAQQAQTPGTAADPCANIPGLWPWFVNGDVTFNSNGTLVQGALTGKWVCTDGHVIIHWSHNYVDNLFAIPRWQAFARN